MKIIPTLIYTARILLSRDPYKEALAQIERLPANDPYIAHIPDIFAAMRADPKRPHQRTIQSARLTGLAAAKSEKLAAVAIETLSDLYRGGGNTLYHMPLIDIAKGQPQHREAVRTLFIEKGDQTALHNLLAFVPEEASALLPHLKHAQRTNNAINLVMKTSAMSPAHQTLIGIALTRTGHGFVNTGLHDAVAKAADDSALAPLKGLSPRQLATEFLRATAALNRIVPNFNFTAERTLTPSGNILLSLATRRAHV